MDQRATRNEWTAEMSFTYDYPRPVLTVDAAVFARHNDHTYMIMIRRGKEPFLHKLALPGGHFDVDNDVTTEEAARRELLEETGFDSPFGLDLVGVFDRKARDPRGRYVSLLFAGFAHTMPKLKAGDDANEAFWYPISSEPHVDAFAFDHYVMQVRAMTWLLTRKFF